MTQNHQTIIVRINNHHRTMQMTLSSLRPHPPPLRLKKNKKLKIKNIAKKKKIKEKNPKKTNIKNREMKQSM